MGEKVYRPIVKEGDHLVKSKDNNKRVRGVSQDKNNKTTDIVEWEEVELADSIYEYPYELESDELTPEQRAFADAISEVLVVAVEQLHEKIIVPWWKKTAKPWLKNKLLSGKQIRLKNATVEVLSVKSKETQREDKNSKTISDAIQPNTNFQIDELLRENFDSIQFEMSTEEAKIHIMRLIYHMLGTAYEIKILSNTRIVDQIEDKTIQIEKQKQVEMLLAEKVTININELLNNEHLLLDVSTSNLLFKLLGGGIRLNGEYIPVEVEKVAAGIDSMNKELE